MTFLDCTLRDGGYYTDWDFETSFVETYLRTVNELPIDIVELGYRSKPLDGYFGEYFYCPQHVFDLALKLAPKKKFCIILDEKNNDAKGIHSLLAPIHDNLYMVRIAVSPEKIRNAIDLAKAVKEFDIKVSLNVMYLTEWGQKLDWLKEYKDELKLIDVLYLVDSFGGILPDEVEYYVSEVRKVYEGPLGFHGHNNLELAMANSIAALSKGVEFVDATFMGMGRGAGNMKTELFLSYLYGKDQSSIDFGQVTTLLNKMNELWKKHQWGTQLPYMLSGVLSIPQKDIMNWVSTRRYSLGTIINAIGNKTSQQADNVQLPEFVPSGEFENCLIVGGGKSGVSHIKAIEELCSRQEICIIHSTTRYATEYASINSPQFYCMSGSETERLEDSLNEESPLVHPFIFPPFPRKMGTQIPSIIENISYEIPSGEWFSDPDSPLSLALIISQILKVSNVYLIGFDGYMDTDFVKIDKLRITQENQLIIDTFREKTGQTLQTLSPSRYQNLKTCSIYQLVS